MSYDKLANQFAFLSLLSQEMGGKNITVIDTKTGGIGPQAPIVEIAWMSIGPDYFDRQSHLVNPEQPVHWAKTRMHGITDEMVKAAPTFTQLYPQIKSALDGHVIAGFGSTRHDIRHIHQTCESKGLDMLDLSRKLDVRDLWRVMTRQDEGNLRDLCAFYNVEAGYLPRAMTDVMMSARVLNKMIVRHGTDFMYMQLHGKHRSGQQEGWMAVVDDELVREVLSTSVQRQQVADTAAQQAAAQISELQTQSGGLNNQRVIDVPGQSRSIGYDFTKVLEAMPQPHATPVPSQPAPANTAPQDKATMDSVPASANPQPQPQTFQPDLTDWDNEEFWEGYLNGADGLSITPPGHQTQSRAFAGSPSNAQRKPLTFSVGVRNQNIELPPGMGANNSVPNEHASIQQNVQHTSAATPQYEQPMKQNTQKAASLTTNSSMLRAVRPRSGFGNQFGQRSQSSFKEPRESRLQAVIHEHIAEHGKVLEKDYEGLAKKAGCKASSVAFTVSEMFNKGKLLRDEVEDKSVQALIMPHLNDVVKSVGEGAKISVVKNALQEAMGGQTVDYIQLHVAMKELEIQRMQEGMREQNQQNQRPQG